MHQLSPGPLTFEIIMGMGSSRSVDIRCCWSQNCHLIFFCPMLCLSNAVLKMGRHTKKYQPVDKDEAKIG